MTIYLFLLYTVRRVFLTGKRIAEDQAKRLSGRIAQEVRGRCNVSLGTMIDDSSNQLPSERVSVRQFCEPKSSWIAQDEFQEF